MKNVLFPSLVLALATAAPMVAHAQQRMTKDQLIAYAEEQNTCEDNSVVDAYYENDTSNVVKVVCGDATGFLPLAGLGGFGAAAAGAVMVAAAAGGGGSTPDTQ